MFSMWKGSIGKFKAMKKNIMNKINNVKLQNFSYRIAEDL